MSNAAQRLETARLAKLQPTWNTDYGGRDDKRGADSELFTQDTTA